MIRETCLVVLALALAACGTGASGFSREAPANRDSGTAAAAAPTSATAQRDVAFLRKIRGDLLAMHVMLDGAPITDLRPAGPCAGTVTTAREATTFRWALLGDMAPIDDKRQFSMPLVAAGRTHTLSMASGSGADHVVSEFGVLELRCQDGR